MPRFFLPGMEDNPELAEETYRALRIFARDKTLWRIEPDRVYGLTYQHDGAEHRVTVGEAEPRTGERVLAILRSEAYVVCTPTHGGVGGQPLLVPLSAVTNRLDFDPDDGTMPDRLAFARDTLSRCAETLDAVGDARERLYHAAAPLITLSLSDFPPLLGAEYLSLLHRLSWQPGVPGQTSLSVTVNAMTDDEVVEATRALRELAAAVQA